VFDVGFSELLLCFIVALVVLGPQKLPAVARTLGRWTARARSYVRNLSSELERESGGSGIRREIEEAARAMRETASGVKEDLRRLGDSATGAGASADDGRKP